MAFAEQLQQAWYDNKKWPYLLLPLAFVYGRLAGLRKRYLLARQQKLTTPVIVVGNITVGGTGKTPLIIALVKGLQALGLSPGVISRGYGGRPPHLPFLVPTNGLPEHSGDEPLLIRRACGCPVVVDPDRFAAAKFLQQQQVDIILSDDGLQHYALPRTLEIVVVDGTRGLGNKQLLPAGPLRETADRLHEVDWCVVNGEGEYSPNQITMRLQPSHWVRLADGAQIPLTEFNPADPVAALAGIGNPQRFFATLSELHIPHSRHCFTDHHRFVREDLVVADAQTIVMTEKDAVKCAELIKAMPESAQSFFYALAVEAVLPEGWIAQLWQTINHFCPGLDGKVTALNKTEQSNSNL